MDSNERARAEESLRKSEAKYRSLFDNMLNGFAYCRMIYDDDRPRDFLYLAVNKAFEELTGLKDVVGKTVSEVIPGIRESNPNIFEIYGRVARTGRPERFDTYVEPMRTWFSISVYSAEQGCFAAVFDNISERKQAEEARDATIDLLRICNEAGTSQELMRGLVAYFQRLTGCEAVGARVREGDDYPYYETRGFSEEFVRAESSLCKKDREGRVIRESTGHPVLDCMCGNVLRGRFDPSKPFFTPHGSFWSNGTTALLATTTEADRQGRTRNRCNGEGYESVALVPLRAHGVTFGLFQFNDRRKGRFTADRIALLENLVTYVAIALAKLEADAALRESSRFNQQIIEGAGDGVIVYGRDWRYQVWNPCMERFSGLAASEVLGRHPLELCPFLQDAGIIERIEKALAGRTLPPLDFPYDSPHADRHGWASYASVPLRNTKGEIVGVIATVRDITDRMLAAEALYVSEEKFSTAFRNAPLIMALSDLETGTFIEVNEKFVETSGFARDEAIGRTSTDLGWSSPEDRNRIVDAVRTRGIVANLEIEVSTRNGGRIPCLYFGEVITVAGSLRLLSIAQDISERKKADREREELQAQLRHAQKMEAVGRLAGGVAHDFNNMLNVILGFTEIALSCAETGDPLYKNLLQIQKAGQRSADLIGQLLAFSRKQVRVPVVVNLNERIAEQRRMLSRLIGEDIAIDFAPGDGLWNIRIDPSQIDQVLTNLAVNARDAVAGVGTVRIETANVTLDGIGNRSLHLRSGEYVLLTFSDTGAGMDAETRERIFEPFFTTKGEGKGTGLGLSTVYGIVRQNEGAIHVSSEPGRGATFTIHLPRFHAETAEPVAIASGTSLAGSETVLLVEDESQILDLARTVLERYGYTVLAAATPEEGCAIGERHAGDIALLLSDVVLPGMNGKDLQARIERLKPGIRTLFMSGYTADVIAHRGVLDEGIHFLSKPFSMESLAGKVRAVLDEKKSGGNGPLIGSPE